MLIWKAGNEMGPWRALLLIVISSILLLGCEDTNTQGKRKKSVMAPNSPMAKLTCKANRNTLQKAVGMYMTQKKRLPQSLEELESMGMFDKKVRCPSGGTYLFGARGVVTCSIHK